MCECVCVCVSVSVCVCACVCVHVCVYAYIIPYNREIKTQTYSSLDEVNGLVHILFVIIITNWTVVLNSAKSIFRGFVFLLNTNTEKK